MTAFVSGLGRDLTPAQFAGLRRVSPFLKRQVASAVRLKFAPELHFQPDTALDYAMKIDAVMKRPEVQRDLGARPPSEGDPMRGGEGRRSRVIRARAAALAAPWTRCPNGPLPEDRLGLQLALPGPAGEGGQGLQLPRHHRRGADAPAAGAARREAA
jgi:hypothetical protein